MNKIEELAEAYADAASEGACSLQWPEFKDNLKKAFMEFAGKVLSSKWVSVEECLPGNGQKILVASKHYNHITESVIDLVLVDRYFDNGGFLHDNVYAWMVIPVINIDKEKEEEGNDGNDREKEMY